MNCLFCEIVNKKIPSKTIYEDDIVQVFLDVNPEHNGHCLIVPKKHYLDITDISEETLNYINKISKKIYYLLMEKLHPDGISLCQNNGLPQAIKHYHMHLIPKYKSEQKLNVDDIYNILTK